MSDQVDDEAGSAEVAGQEDQGSHAPNVMKQIRRSRRLRGDPPEPFLAAIGHGTVPRPWSVPRQPAASYSLYPGASPLLVPDWLPEVIAGDQ